jgi:hypothetical protein
VAAELDAKADFCVEGLCSTVVLSRSLPYSRRPLRGISMCLRNVDSFAHIFTALRPKTKMNDNNNHQKLLKEAIEVYSSVNQSLLFCLIFICIAVCPLYAPYVEGKECSQNITGMCFSFPYHSGRAV